MTPLERFVDALRCPSCGGGLRNEAGGLRCDGCQKRYDVKDGKAFFITPYGDIVPTIREGSKNPERWTAWRKSNYGFFKRLLADAKDDAAVLDFGTGQGQFHDLFARFRAVIAADFFPYPDANVVCDLTTKLPLRDAGVDVIVASNVFEHLPNTAEVLGECRRVLKPGGRLLATVPFLLRVHQEPYDFHRYTPFMLKRLLEGAGFADIDVEPLATPADVYLQTQKHFFGMLFDEAESIASPLDRLVYTIRLKCFWKTIQALQWLEGSLLRRAKPSERFTLGYGFNATNR